MKAGWIVALVYLLCVMAPTLSYALPGEHSAASCMTAEGVMPGSRHMHDEVTQPMHVYLDDQTHDHLIGHSMAMSDEDEQSAMSAAMDGDAAPSKKGPHTTGGKCCAQMCVTAMVASTLNIASPSMPTIVRIVTSYRVLADNAPAVHYRPPIA